MIDDFDLIEAQGLVEALDRTTIGQGYAWHTGRAGASSLRCSISIDESSKLKAFETGRA